MNKRELEEIRWLQKDIERVELILEGLKAEVSPKTRSLDGMPLARTNNVTDPTGDLAIEIDYYRDELNAYKDRLFAKKAAVELWLNELDDPQLKLIIHYRCVEQMQWEDIAAKIGGDNTGDSLRMYYTRHIK